MATGPAPHGGHVLTDEQRDALSRELFGLWRVLAPRAHHCFCGDDRALVAAVAHARRRVAELDGAQRAAARSRSRTRGRDGSGGR